MRLIGIVVLIGCHLTANPTAQTEDVNAAFADLRNRIDAYLELRAEARNEVGPGEVTDDPARIRKREEALAARIVAHRERAQQGDIFSPAIRMAVRHALRPHTEGEPGRKIKSALKQDAPAPGAVRLKVNTKYPTDVPRPTTPPTVLHALPALPRQLEYRIIGKDLVLLDGPANLIVDYMRNAID